MSTGLKVGLTFARDCALQVCERLAIDQAGVMGSIRRGCGSVGDIDLVAPMPVSCPSDALYSKILRNFQEEDKPEMLPRPVVAGALGKVVQGVKPGFKACALMARFGDLDIKVEIHRYVDGPRGNRGWIEILRTGPAEYGQGFLSRWKSVQRIQMVNRGSIDGFLVDCRGVAVPTPTEEVAFEMAGLKFVPPEKRPSVDVIGGMVRGSGGGGNATSGISLSSAGAA